MTLDPIKYTCPACGLVSPLLLPNEAGRYVCGGCLNEEPEEEARGRLAAEDMHRLALGGSSAVSAQASEPTLADFKAEFDKLGYLWSSSNVEKARLGWKLAMRHIAAQAPQAPADAMAFINVIKGAAFAGPEFFTQERCRQMFDECVRLEGLPRAPGGQDAEDAARWRALVAQHEIDDDQLSHDNYGKTYPKRTFCVFEDDGADGLEPIPCDPGSLVERIDAARKAQEGK